MCVVQVYPNGYLQMHTDQRRRAQGWRLHSVVGASGCCLRHPSAPASGDTLGPRLAGLCTPSGDAPAAPCLRCSSESLASTMAAARTSSASEDSGRVGDERVALHRVKQQKGEWFPCYPPQTTYPRYMLPASIYIMFYPTQHGSVHFLLRWHIEIVTGNQI